jgi:predicted dehydrogenase
MAIVGMGSIGRRHLRVLKTIRPDIEVIQVRSGHGRDCPEADIARFNVRTVEDAVLLGAESAIIASPAPFHVTQAMTLMESGVSVLIEKPLSHNQEGVRELAALSKKKNVTALVGYVLRYSRSLQYLHEMIRKGKVGDLLFVRIECGSYLPNWRPGQDYTKSVSAQRELGGGVLLELSHELDYANALFGPFESVNGVVKNTGSLRIDVEDFSHTTFLSKFAGCPVMVTLDFCRRDTLRSCSVHGVDGTLVWDGINHDVTWNWGSGLVEKERFDIEPDEIFRHQIKHFLNCVESGEAPRVTIDDAAAVLEMIEAARKAHAENRTVFL